MARRISFNSGLAALVIFSARTMAFLYNIQIRIAQIKRAVGIVLALAVLVFAGEVAYVSLQIAHQSSVDEARPADIILVLGAAEIVANRLPCCARVSITRWISIRKGSRRAF